MPDAFEVFHVIVSMNCISSDNLKQNCGMSSLSLGSNVAAILEDEELRLCQFGIEFLTKSIKLGTF